MNKSESRIGGEIVNGNVYMPQNRIFLINWAGKIVRLLLLSQATNSKTEGISDIENEFVDREESCKQTFSHFYQDYS